MIDVDRQQLFEENLPYKIERSKIAYNPYRLSNIPTDISSEKIVDAVIIENFKDATTQIQTPYDITHEFSNEPNWYSQSGHDITIINDKLQTTTDYENDQIQKQLEEIRDKYYKELVDENGNPRECAEERQLKWQKSLEDAECKDKLPQSYDKLTYDKQLGETISTDAGPCSFDKKAERCRTKLGDIYMREYIPVLTPLEHVEEHELDNSYNPPKTCPRKKRPEAHTILHSGLNEKYDKPLETYIRENQDVICNYILIFLIIVVISYIICVGFNMEPVFPRSRQSLANISHEKV